MTGFLFVEPKSQKIYFLFVELVIFHSLFYNTHKLDSCKVLLFLCLVFLFDFTQFFQLGLHLYNLFFSVGNLVSDRVDLFGTWGEFDVGKDINGGFTGLDALFLMKVFEMLVVDIGSSFVFGAIHLNKIIEL